jgi:hypothetical protein
MRKFGITVMHGKVSEPVFKLMTGKHISSDLKTYIQANKETRIAFKQIEPLISLTKTNGSNGNAALMKQLDELKKTTFKQMALLKMFEKMLSTKEKEKIMLDLAKEFGIKLEVREIHGHAGRATIYPTLEEFSEQLGEAIEKKDLEKILKENGNGNNNH